MSAFSSFFLVFLSFILIPSAYDISPNSSCSNASKDCGYIRDCYYHDYLQLDKILNANTPRTAEYLTKPSHDEVLFITIHQTYELWFKQILFELDSCIDYLNNSPLIDRDIITVSSRFNRINVILNLLVDQWDVLDLTMTPLDYLDFRKYLQPASGFQSVQFRIFENTLGLDKNKRLQYNNAEYTKVLSEEHAQKVESKYNPDVTLFNAVEKWLQRFPYLNIDDWSFWDEYRLVVPNRDYFDVLFDEAHYDELLNQNKVRLSYKSLKAALMIMLYRDEPILQMPFRVIESLMDMDNLLTEWRGKHALMVHRMIGSKLGTGGSSGFEYLRATAQQHTVFDDFFGLSTYMIPKSNLPELPDKLKFFMNFPK